MPKRQRIASPVVVEEAMAPSPLADSDVESESSSASFSFINDVSMPKRQRIASPVVVEEAMALSPLADSDVESESSSASFSFINDVSVPKHQCTASPVAVERDSDTESESSFSSSSSDSPSSASLSPTTDATSESKEDFESRDEQLASAIANLSYHDAMLHHKALRRRMMKDPAGMAWDDTWEELLQLERRASGLLQPDGKVRGALALEGKLLCYAAICRWAVLHPDLFRETLLRMCDVEEDTYLGQVLTRCFPSCGVFEVHGAYRQCHEYGPRVVCEVTFWMDDWPAGEETVCSSSYKGDEWFAWDATSCTQLQEASLGGMLKHAKKAGLSKGCQQWLRDMYKAPQKHAPRMPVALEDCMLRLLRKANGWMNGILWIMAGTGGMVRRTKAISKNATLTRIVHAAAMPVISTFEQQEDPEDLV